MKNKDYRKERLIEGQNNLVTILNVIQYIYNYKAKDSSSNKIYKKLYKIIKSELSLSLKQFKHIYGFTYIPQGQYISLANIENTSIYKRLVANNVYKYMNTNN